MKTVIRITNDYDSQHSYFDWREDINSLVNDEVHCFVEIANKSLINVIEEEKNYLSHKEDYTNKTVVSAKGYSQGDWQEYTIYHNHEEDSEGLKYLVDELQKSFTHFNDYQVEKFKRTEIDGEVFNSEPYSYEAISIRHTEFPDKDDVLKEYVEIFGEDFDEVEFELD